MRTNILVFFFLVLFSAKAQVKQDSTVTELLQEIVISSLHVNDSLMRAAASVAVVSQSQLQRGNATDISHVLNLIPGVLMQSGALNTNRISIRGIGARTPFGTNKIRAFYGNIPLTSGDSETTIEDLDLQNLSSVEIIKGPLSSIYGAGLGGAILITPENYNADNVRLSSGYGSFGMRKFNAGAGASGKIGSINATYSTLQTDGWRQNSNSHREAQTVSGQLFVGRNGTLSYLMNHTYLKAFIPSSINKEMFENSPRAAAGSWLAAKGFEQYDSYLAGLNYDVAVGKIKNQSSVFLNAKIANEPRPFDILKQNTVGYGARTQFNREFDWLSAAVILGGEFFQDKFDGRTFQNLYEQNNGNGSLQGERLTETNQKRTFYNGFGQFRIQPLKRFEVQAGFNFNRTQFSLDNSFPETTAENYKYETIFSPQISVLFIPTVRQTFYVSVSRGFSLPSVEETLTATGTINSRIRPEIGTNVELGAKSFFLDNCLYVEIAAYDMAISNLLVARRIGEDQYVGVNAGKTSHRGLEWLAKFRMMPANWTVDWFVSGSVGKYQFKDFKDGESDFSGNELPGVPTAKIGGGVTATAISGLYFSCSYLFTGEISMNDANTDFNESYSLLNIESGWNFPILKNGLVKFSAGVNNVTDEKYASMVLVNATGVGNAPPRYYYPGLPVNYFGSFSFRWNF